MAGVTIEELGLRFVQICMENYWSGCLLPVFFLAGVLWDIFLSQEKRIQSVPVLSGLSGTYGI